MPAPTGRSPRRYTVGGIFRCAVPLLPHRRRGNDGGPAQSEHLARSGQGNEPGDRLMLRRDEAEPVAVLPAPHASPSGERSAQWSPRKRDRSCPPRSVRSRCPLRSGLRHRACLPSRGPSHRRGRWLLSRLARWALISSGLPASSREPAFESSTGRIRVSSFSKENAIRFAPSQIGWATRLASTRRAGYLQQPFVVVKTGLSEGSQPATAYGGLGRGSPVPAPLAEPHSPKVAGSNRAPATSQGPSKEPLCVLGP